MITFLKDIFTRIFNRIFALFKDGPNARNLIFGFSNELQEIEDSLRDYADGSTISTAKGKLLDNIGERVGEERYGRADEEYRDAILFRIFLNLGSGEAERVIQAAEFFSGGSVLYQEIYPAAFQIAVQQPIPNEALLLKSILQVKPAGVGLLSLVAEPDPNDNILPFAFAGNQPGGGWGSVNDPNIGGVFVHYIGP